MSDFWAPLRRSTQSRIGLGRAGNALPTEAVLQLSAAHSTARDAVHDRLDVADVERQLVEAGFAAPVLVTSRAETRSQYLRRPDLGREPAKLPAISPGELVIVLADGLSAGAVQAHAVPLLGALRTVTPLPIDSIVVATQARVALGDHVGAAASATAVLVIIGERPGLSVSDSLGVYLTWAPRPGRSDAERNCVSNIHPPEGLAYATAARAIAGLLRAASELGESGVRVKDRSRIEIDADGGVRSLDES